jgi:hypothetical protein
MTKRSNKKEQLPSPLTHPDHRDWTWLTRRLHNTLLLSQADIATLNALRPHCAVCHIFVADFAWSRDSMSRSILFVAMCHGETERYLIPFDDLPKIMIGGVAGGEAFTQPKQLENKI